MNKEDSILTARDYMEICKENEYLLTVQKDLRNQVEKLTQENNDLEERVIHQVGMIDILIREKLHLQEEIEHLKQPQIFIDTEDMEERYENDLYVEYLEKEKKHLQSVIDKAIEYLKRKEKEPEWYDTDFLICINILNGGSGNFDEILRSKE